MIVDTNRINRAIEAYGELVSIEAYTTSSFSKWGDLLVSVTTAYTSIPTIFNTYGKQSQFQNEGIFEEGSVSFFFKGSQGGIENRNLIVRSNGERYLIKRVDKHYINGIAQVQEAQVSNE